MAAAFVVGAGGAVGEAASRQLLAAGWNVRASMRTNRSDVGLSLAHAGAKIVRCDIDHDRNWWLDAMDCDAWVFTTHLVRTINALSFVDARLPRIIAISSNNVAIQPEADEYREIKEAEKRLVELAPDAIIVRPTMIYGNQRLPTVTRLLRIAKLSPFLPMPGSGRALVQPVFFEDLGFLIAGLASLADAAGVYAAGGAEILSMQNFFAEILSAAGSSAIVVPIPTPLIWAATYLPTGFTKAQARRAELDRFAITQKEMPGHLVPRTAVGEGLRAHFASLTR